VDGVKTRKVLEKNVLPEYMRWLPVIYDKMGGMGRFLKIKRKKQKRLLKGLSSEERVCEALYQLKNNPKSRVTRFINTSAIQKLDNIGWDFLLVVVSGAIQKFVPVQVKSSLILAKKYAENHRGENILVITVEKRDTCLSLMRKIEAGLIRMP